MSDLEPGRLLTARQVGDLLGLHPETILVWIRRGDLPAFRLPGGAIRIRQTDLDQWLQERATSRREAPTTTPNAARNGNLSSIVPTTEE